MYPHFNPNPKSALQTIKSKKAIKLHPTVKEHAKTAVQPAIQKKTVLKDHEKSAQSTPTKKLPQMISLKIKILSSKITKAKKTDGMGLNLTCTKK